MKTKLTMVKSRIIIVLSVLIVVACAITLHVNAANVGDAKSRAVVLKQRNLEITKIQQAAHTLANMFRDYGLSDKSSRVQQLSEAWKAFEQDKQANLQELAKLSNKPSYTQAELDLLARVIYCEAGSNEIKDEHQQLVGQVVLNRVKSAAWPNTIKDVIYAKGQYTCVGGKFWDDPIPQRCYDNAVFVLEGRLKCPENVVYQANKKLGKGVYKTFKTSYSTTYFCYGKIK